MIYTDPEGVKTAEYYDELGRVIETKRYDGTYWRPSSVNTYDKAGNVKTTRDLISGDGTTYRQISYNYDIMNRMIKSKTYVDSVYSETTKTYDFVGNVISETDAQGYTTSYVYDKLNRVTKVTQNDGTENLDTTYAYDIIRTYGTETYVMNKITDARGRIKQTYLDEFGHAVLEINVGNSTTTDEIKIEREFNADGTLDKITQPKVNDTLGTRQTDDYDYNNWGQVTKVRYDNNMNNQTKYTYNDHGQMASMEDRRADPLFGGLVIVDTSWTYDVLGRVASVTQDGVTIQYEFDKAGKITKLIQPSDEGSGEETTTYSYNDLGQIDEIKQNDKLVREYSYMYNGLLDYTDDHVDFKAVQTPVKVMRTSYGYTNHGQVDTMIYTDVTDPNVTWPDNRLEEYHYSYDKRGNITDETLINKYETDDNGNPVTNTVNKEYTYDSLNRLTQTTVGTTDITKYTYDKVGNKLTEEKYDDTTLENTKTNAYNEFNQLTSTTMSVSGGTAQTIATYSYDDRGNQILAHKRDFGATTWYDTTYQYDRAGYMQKSVTEKPGGITETVGHYYNGMEQRIRKVVDQNTTKYVYTGTTVLFTADDNNDKITENILSPGGQIVASNRFDGIFNGNAFFFNQDIRNSTTAIINKDLEALKYYEYDEQGREEEKGNPNFINENTFTGAISEGGNIFYMNARFYDANTGRFLSQDSYTGNAYEPWSQHLYSYCGNNPVNMIDPTGHCPYGYGSYGYNWSTSVTRSRYEPYLYSYDEVVRTKAKNNDGNRDFSNEEKIFILGFPEEAALVYCNKNRAYEMVDYINEKYELGIYGGPERDGTVLNAFQHAYFAALNGRDIGTKLASCFANAHENKHDNGVRNTTMDLHNNAIGLYISTTSEWKGMSDEEFADYVYQLILEDGYWIKGEEHIPDWADLDESK